MCRGGISPLCMKPWSLFRNETGSLFRNRIEYVLCNYCVGFCYRKLVKSFKKKDDEDSKLVNNRTLLLCDLCDPILHITCTVLPPVILPISPTPSSPSPISLLSSISSQQPTSPPPISPPSPLISPSFHPPLHLPPSPSPYLPYSFQLHVLTLLHIFIVAMTTCFFLSQIYIHQYIW